MEKTSDFQYSVFNKDGKLKLRLPGGEIIDYDNRFTDCPLLQEGESFIKPKED